MTNPTDPRIEAFLDERMSPSERQSFLDLLERDALLRTEFDRQRSIDASLRRIWGDQNIEGIMGRVEAAIAQELDTPVARRPSTGPWRLLAAAALLGFSLAGVWYSWTITRPPPFVDVYEPQPWRSFGTVYYDTIRNGFKPAWICRDEQQFERVFTKRFRQPLLLATMPSGITAGGISYSNTLSNSTINVLGKVDGIPVMVFVDQRTVDHGSPPPPPPGLNLFRREIDALVLYELTPLDRPNILPFFYKPNKK